MSLTMRAGTVDDIDRLVEIYFSAFADNAVQHRVFPESSPQVRPFWRNNFVNDFKEDYVRFRVMEQPSSGDSEDKKEIVAFAIWNAPRKPTDPIPAMPPREAWPSDGDQDAAVEFFHDLERQHKSYMAHPTNPGEQQPHWRRWRSGALLRWGEQQADEQGVPCYLDATPDGRPVYMSKGHGFREVESRTYFGGVYEHVFMIRDPKKKDE